MRGARPMRSTRRLQNLTGTLPRWWTITNKRESGEPTLVSIYDEIGFYGVSAGEFLAELSGVDGDLEVHLNSPGGDVFDAIAIYNSLKARRGVVAITVDGLAASAASFIAQAASPGRLEMAPFSTLMIHDGFAAGIGNAADMRELADQLDDASDNIAGIYAERTGKPAAYWRAKMRATTWYKDAEAVADGLADRIRGEDGTVRDAWDLSVFNSDAPAGDRDAVARETVTVSRPQAAASPGHGPFTGTHTHRHATGDDQGDDATHEHEHTHDGDNNHDHTHAGAGGSVTGHAHADVRNEAAREQAVAALVAAGCSADDLQELLRDAVRNEAAVDNSAWDASKAWHNGVQSDDPEAFYRGICAGKRTGDPATQDAWALPYKYHPSDPPNAAGVRAALARLTSTQGLINKAEAEDTLQAAMKKINPDYKPGDHIDGGLLQAVLAQGLKGAAQ